jgi:hypothetical protein
MNFTASGMIFSLLFALFLIMESCGSKEKPNQQDEEPVVENVLSKDTIYIGDSYPKFPDLDIIEVLDSMRFCELVVDKSIPDSLQLYPCADDLFGIFNNSSGNWQNGFLLEARQGVWAKSSRIFNIEKVEGTYIVTNDMKGQLLYMIPTATKHDMVLRYYDSQVGTVAIQHSWNGKTYKPVNVVMLNDFHIKPKFQDSLNQIYIDNFIWGY